MTLSEDTTTKVAYLLTGGNQGDRGHYLNEAARALEEKAGRILRRSSIYETAAWGEEAQEAFLNQVLELQTNFSPEDLLHCLLTIETDLGRRREKKYGPRTIDIDILFYNDLVMHQPGLTLPHPRMAERRFVLVPLAELAPDKQHPVLKKTVRQLLRACSDPLAVNKFY